MPSERVQRQIDRLLDEAEAAIREADWPTVRLRVGSILALDPENQDATSYLEAADRASSGGSSDSGVAAVPVATLATTPAQPTSFANGRYTVKRFLGEGGKKKVYLAHDSLLDRDVAFALIKTEGLDEASRMRVTREAQAMGRLGDHPNIVTVYDIGEENGAPYMVLPVLSGGDVEGVIEKAPDQRMPLERALKIAIETCRGLEFAHSKGIVHRDLKPGNVWLSEDGSAKIGDFGLAVATDRSRLTQAGMMVGTVSYMPPEQAMGGEVGPRSDLYSLGAMLYEMVCGRPPFVGDESVAIIGQHLNTPPIAPTWHRPDCPPALEALILRLLEKDPSKRPASATEVKQALESVNLDAASTRREPTIATEAASAGENPLYRRTFVGRENEVKQLQAAFDAALSGQGGLVMVVGEPGIGKTALCEQLATYVALRGGKALVGHCYEEGSLSLPYLAFVEAMRSYVLAREPDGLRSDLGTGAADVARIVSEVRDRVQGVELRPNGDPEDDRWRLLQAITSFLRNASTVQPLCMVLEDLHWADRGTLDVLLHVARNLSGARLLIVGNYRDVEVDRTHPLSGVLADLRRINSFTSVRLRGLTVDEVHRMYEAVRGQATPWGQAEAVFRATEGNPLFVQEVLRYLVEEGIVVRDGARYVAQDAEGVGIPEGLRDVVGKRLSRLSDKANQVLAVAAVMGREFRLDLLQKVASLSDEDVDVALQEAQERAIIEPRSSLGALGFRFSHAFFRQTLYEEIFASRRLRLHQQVARALEEVYVRRLEEHASELAEHFAQSTDAVDLEKALHYSELAAQRAASVFDYGEAVRHLEQALKVLEVLDRDDREKRCDLLLALGDALIPAGLPQRAVVILEEAFTIAEALQDRARCSRSCQLALEANQSYSGAIVLSGRRRWVARADKNAKPASLERVRTDLEQANLFIAAGHPAEAQALCSDALALARELDDVGALISAGRSMLGFAGPKRWLECLNLPDELLREPWQSRSPREQANLLGACYWAYLRMGRRDKLDGLSEKLVELSLLTRHPNIVVQADAVHNAPLVLDGRLEEAIIQADALANRLEELGIQISVNTLAAGARGAVKLYLGKGSEYAAEIEEFQRRLGIRDDGRWPMLVPKAVALCLAGRKDEARECFDRFWQANELIIDDLISNITTRALELSVLLGEKEATAKLLRALLPVKGTLTTGLGCVSRHLGAAAALLGRPDEAREYYGQALDVCAKVRFRPEIALTRLSLAELLLEHYPEERDAAIEHLDFAIAELRDMKMQPALERALRHRGLLKA